MKKLWLTGSMAAAARASVLLACAAACALSLAACGSGPSKSDIKTAVDAQFQKDDPICWNVTNPNPTFPLRVTTNPNRPLHAILQGLAHENLITLQQVEGSGFFAQPATQITITDKGNAAKAWTPGKGFCVGRRGVDVVQDFTEPAPANGVTVSQANFTWKVVDVPPWATREDFAGVPGMTRPGEGKAILVKTNEGWRADQVSTDQDLKDAGGG